MQRIYFSEGVQLIAEVAKSRFFLIAFISQQAFSHLLYRIYFYLYSMCYCCVLTVL